MSKLSPSSPAKIVRRKSFSSYEELQRSCCKKLIYDNEEKKPRRNTLLIAVLRRNYNKRIMEEAAMERQKIEANQKNNRLIFIKRSKSLNFGKNVKKNEKKFDFFTQQKSESLEGKNLSGENLATKDFENSKFENSKKSSQNLYSKTSKLSQFLSEISSPQKLQISSPQKLQISFTKHPENFSENFKKLKEKTDYVQQLEVEFNDAKAKRQKTEEEEERLKKMLKANKNYLQSLYQQFKVLAAHKKAKAVNEKDLV